MDLGLKKAKLQKIIKNVVIDQTERFKLLLSVSTSLYIRATLLCLTFYIHTHERASKQTWLRGYPAGA